MDAVVEHGVKEFRRQLNGANDAEDGEEQVPRVQRHEQTHRRSIPHQVPRAEHHRHVERRDLKLWMCQGCLTVDKLEGGRVHNPQTFYFFRNFSRLADARPHFTRGNVIIKRNTVTLYAAVSNCFGIHREMRTLLLPRSSSVWQNYYLNFIKRKTFDCRIKIGLIKAPKAHNGNVA